jgi:hypothetical protein
MQQHIPAAWTQGNLRRISQQVDSLENTDARFFMQVHQLFRHAMLSFRTSLASPACLQEKRQVKHLSLDCNSAAERETYRRAGSQWALGTSQGLRAGIMATVRWLLRTTTSPKT